MNKLAIFFAMVILLASIDVIAFLQFSYSYTKEESNTVITQWVYGEDKSVTANATLAYQNYYKDTKDFLYWGVKDLNSSVSFTNGNYTEDVTGYLPNTHTTYYTATISNYLPLGGILVAMNVCVLVSIAIGLFKGKNDE